jgi:hypothetical protein
VKSMRVATALVVVMHMAIVLLCALLLARIMG